MKRITGVLLLLVCLAGVVAAAYRFWPHEPLPKGVRADLVTVDKSERRLTLLRSGTPIASYRVALGGAPTGHKVQEGDERTPEGRYVIDWRNAGSAFHRSMHISYPNAKDRKTAAKLGVSPGGAIMIHGLKNGMGWVGRLHVLADWTNGCIAVTNLEIEDIWRAVPNGTPIEIRP